MTPSRPFVYIKKPQRMKLFSYCSERSAGNQGSTCLSVEIDRLYDFLYCRPPRTEKQMEETRQMYANFVLWEEVGGRKVQ